MRGFIGALGLVGFLLVDNGAVGQENTAVVLGRSIYESGIGRDGREVAAKVHGRVPLTGAAIACAGCHGRDGRGGGEAFVRAPDIRWFSLSKPYPARRAGSAGVPYDQASFAKTLRLGISPEGIRLDPTMPRFDLADDEVGGLVAYLSTLRESPSSVKAQPAILGLLPMPEVNSGAGVLAMKLQSCHGSALKTRFAAIDILYFRDPEDAIAKVDDRLRRDHHALILAPYLMGWETRYMEAAVRWNVPTLLPLSLLDPPEPHNWYYRFPGLEAQIAALLKAAKDSGRSRLRLMYDARIPLSLQLKTYSLEAAQRYGFTIEDDASKGLKDSESAVLWLISFSEKMGGLAYRQGELMLMPALFYVPENVRAVVGKGSGIRLRVAYPYPPRSTKEKVWRAPVDVWAGAACELMARFSDGVVPSELMPGARVRWEQDLFLLARPSEAELVDQVFLADETYAQ